MVNPRDRLAHALKVWPITLAGAIAAVLTGCSGQSDEGNVVSGTVPDMQVSQRTDGAAEDRCDRYREDPSAEQFVTDLARSLAAIGAASQADAPATARTMFTSVELRFRQLRPGAAERFTTWYCQHVPTEEWLHANGTDVVQHRKVLEVTRGYSLFVGLSGCNSLRSATVWSIEIGTTPQAEIEAALTDMLCPT